MVCIIVGMSCMSSRCEGIYRCRISKEVREGLFSFSI